MRLISEMDKTSGIVAGNRCYGPRFTNILEAVQRFAALGDVVGGGSQNIAACGVWALVRITVLVSSVTMLRWRVHHISNNAPSRSLATPPTLTSSRTSS